MNLQLSDYASEPGALTLEEMQEIHQEMLTGLEKDEDGRELYQELVAVAVKYAAVRQEWLLLSLAKQAERDASRTAIHDSLIIKFNMLERYQKMNGKGGTWRERLGDEKENRKRIGDMGCYIAFVQGLCGR